MTQIINSYERKGSMNWKAQVAYYTKKWLIRTAFALLLVVGISNMIQHYWNQFHIPSIAPYIAERTEAASADRLDRKIAELKADVIAKLESCESGKATEPDALIVFDSNKVASLGRLQFQVKTVQHYMQKFYGEDITKLEAIAIAHDGAKAETLAEKIIFGEIGGLWNWRTCAERLKLAPRVEFIRDLLK